MRVVPDVVFDRATVGDAARTGRSIDLAGPAALAADDRAEINCVEPGGQQVVPLLRRPGPLQVAHGAGNDQGLVDGVDAPSVAPGRVGKSAPAIERVGG